jgi:hypothetical protein
MGITDLRHAGFEGSVVIANGLERRAGKGTITSMGTRNGHVTSHLQIGSI